MIAFPAFLSRRALLSLATAVVVSAFAHGAAFAMEIQRVVSPGGVEVWLVTEPNVPIIAMDYSFLGGSSQDPADKPGVANMMSALLDEGAGDLDSKTFHERLADDSISLQFRAGRDYMQGSLRTLSENRDKAFDLLQIALKAPRFDAVDVERIRGQLLSQLRRETTSPNDIASKIWWSTAFPDHPYGRPTSGSLQSVPTITADDLHAMAKTLFARDTLKVGIVGDIDAKTAGELVDRVFGGLPEKSTVKPVPVVAPKGLGRRIVAPLDVPQAVVTYGGIGLPRNDPDFMAAYIVNYVLGGGSFSSRLYREIREKRGLAYGVYDSLVWLKGTSLLLGGTATRADRTAETLSLIDSEMKKLADEGPTQDELDKAKSYLIGSFALNLDTSTKIAAQLVQMQVDNLGIDYIEKRPNLIGSVTLADAKRVAKRLLDGGLLVTVAGRPQGVTSTN